MEFPCSELVLLANTIVADVSKLRKAAQETDPALRTYGEQMASKVWTSSISRATLGFLYLAVFVTGHSFSSYAHTSDFMFLTWRLSSGSGSVRALRRTASEVGRYL